MTGLTATARLGRRLAELSCDYQDIKEVDAILCEDNCTVMFYCDLRDGRSIIVGTDLPAPIDPASFDDRRWRDDFTCALLIRAELGLLR